MRDRKNESAAPRGWRRRLVFGLAWLGVAGGAYYWGRHGNLPQATAAPPAAQAKVEAIPVSDVRPPDYARRPVAFLYGNVTITREDLGEYLIERVGKERLKNLINKRIIEHAAKQRGVEVAPAEITAALSADAAQLGVSPKEFVNQILKRYNKSLLEWQEDVLKPRLLMEKMCRARVSVTREDLAQAYEAHFGEKVDCKIIMWPKSEEKAVMKNWPKIRASNEEFDHFARLQASPSLAAVGGHVKALGHHTTGSERLEKVLFGLRPGEVSEVLDEPEGLVVIKCIGKVPPDTSKTFEQRRPDLEKEVFDKKVAMEIAKLFEELKKQANPRNLMEPASRVVEDVKRELQTDPSTRNLVNAAGSQVQKPAPVAPPPPPAAGVPADARPVVVPQSLQKGPAK
jgi:hypothetical protein